MHLRPLGQLSTSIFQSVFPTNKNSFKKLLGRKTGKKTKNYSIFKFENPNKIKVFLRTKLPNSLKFSSADPSATWVHLRITGLLYTPWGGFVNHKCGIIRVYLLIIKKSIDNGGGLCYTFPQIEAHRVNSTPPVARLGGRRDRGGKGPVPKWLPWQAVGWQCGEYPLCCRSNAEGYPP